MKIFRGSPFQTLDPPKKKCGLDFDSPFSVSSVEDDHLGKLNELKDHSLKDPLETNLNDLFQNDEKLNVGNQTSRNPSQSKHSEIPAHLKSIVEKCKLVFD